MDQTMLSQDTQSLPEWQYHAPQYLHKHFLAYSMPILPDMCLCLDEWGTKFGQEYILGLALL